MVPPQPRPQSPGVTPPRTIEISDEQQYILDGLCELIPDFDPGDPGSLQRIFGLGLIVLTTQVASKSSGENQTERARALVVSAREMVDTKEG